MQHVAQETGVQIVACTGIYTYDYLPHYFENRDIDQMAELFVSDIRGGMQGTDAKAAFLKCAADAAGVTENVEKVHRAVARASRQTGAPIMAHSRPASDTGPRQVAIFEEEGVDPAKVQIAHTGDTDDLEYIEELLARGPWIGMDRYGLDIILPTEQRNKTVVALCERGHADRMMLSQDACATIDWFPPEMVAELAPKWNFTFVLDEVVPALREAGVADEQVTAMMQDAPRRWLAG
jgi:phosphotriesterase-related protein